MINYKAYIELLTKYLKISYSNSMNNNKITSDQLKRGNIALKAATELCLSSLRHFNFREELFTIIIKRLNKTSTSTRLSNIYKIFKSFRNFIKR